MADNTKIEWTDALSEIDCAYMAGLIDGEGSIYVMKHKEKTFYPAIALMMTNRDAVAWFASKIGVAVADVPRTPEGWRPQFSARIHGKRAVALCHLLLPYLKVKHRQAQLLLDFPCEDRRGRGRKLLPEIAARRASLRELVNKLNTRGVQ